MVPEKQIDEFVSRLRQSAGENLRSVIRFGSAAAGEYHRDFSNINLLCIVGETSFPKLAALASDVAWWDKQKHRAPLLMTHEELRRSSDVFSIELLDMQQRHRVLFGEDVLSGLKIPMHLHRAQVEYELREKLILLRQNLLLVSANKKQLWDLLLRSVSAFATLFRHALIALGHPAPNSKREAIEKLMLQIKFDPSAFFQLLDIREHKAERTELDENDVANRYLDAIQKVTAAVDAMLDSPAR